MDRGQIRTEHSKQPFRINEPGFADIDSLDGDWVGRNFARFLRRFVRLL